MLRLHPVHLLAIALIALVGATRAGAASKVTIAAIGDGAPGGGVFAGPGFSGWPSAAGGGWVAFRGQIVSGPTAEAIVAVHMAAPRSSVQVAALGQRAPGTEGQVPDGAGKPPRATFGRFKQFVGRPAVNANGDVAFFASVGREDQKDEDGKPTAAGLFLFRAARNQLVSVVQSRQTTAAGVLDLIGSTDPTTDTGAIDVPQRTPALNDQGDVAFVSPLAPKTPADLPSAAIFLKPAADDLRAVVRVGDAAEGGRFDSPLGPPALNNHGTIAFHGLIAATSAPADFTRDGEIEGIYEASGGATSLAVAEGQFVMPINQRVTSFGDSVALDDQGDLAFIGGDFADFSPDANVLNDGTTAIVILHAGMLNVVGYPGEPLLNDRVSSIALGPAAGSVDAPPSLAPDGSVAFLVTLNGGGSQAIARFDGTQVRELTVLGGAAADAAPPDVGGTFQTAESGVAMDAVGGVVFLARILNGGATEAIVYRPAAGNPSAVKVGDPTPGNGLGFFGGPPFSLPLLNDAGDVVFRAFVAQGPSSVGLFRSRAGKLEVLVRSGDPAPKADGTPGPTILDLVGEGTLNSQGDVVFAALVEGAGRGLYLWHDATRRVLPIAVRNDDAPPGPFGEQAKFGTLGQNPALDDTGAVAFRATSRHRDLFSQLPIKQDGIFVRDAQGSVHTVALEGGPAPVGQTVTFFKLRDPELTGTAGVTYRTGLAPSGIDRPGSGIFLSDPHGTVPVAVEKQDLGDGVTLSTFSGTPATDRAGDVAFLAGRLKNRATGKPQDLGPAIMRRTAAGLEMLIARNMRGPAGGSFRSLGPPIMSSAGHIAFRGSFTAGTGGTPGFFLLADGALSPFLQVGEASPLGGRFASYGARAGLNAHDELVFIGGVARGSARTGVFLASPTTLTAHTLGLAVRTGRKRHRDRVRLDVTLHLGINSNGVDPLHEPVNVALANGKGEVLWSVTVPKGAMRRRGRTYVALVGRKRLRKDVESLRLDLGRRGSVQATVVSAPVTLQGTDPLNLRDIVGPFTVTLQVGDDSGVALIPCQVGRRGARCGDQTP